MQVAHGFPPTFGGILISSKRAPLKICKNIKKLLIEKGDSIMINISTIATLYAERRYFWHMINCITTMTAMEENISPEFRSLIGKMQEKANVLYLEISDMYYETKGNSVKTDTELDKKMEVDDNVQ